MSHTYAGNSVAIVSSTDANPIAIVATSHGRTTGDRVLIAGHLVNTRANGEWVITVTGANGFTLDSSGAATGAGAGGATGTVTRFAATATLPDDITDQRSAASVNSPFGTALDRAQMLYQDFKQRMLGLFPIVPARSITRQFIGNPSFQYTAQDPNWTEQFDGIWRAEVTGATMKIPFNPPHGSLLTGARVAIYGGNGHAAFPAGAPTMPTLKVYYVPSATAIATQIGGTATDPSASVAVYEDAHYFGISGLTHRVDRTANGYFLILAAEGGANYETHSGYITSEVTCTVGALDIGGM